MDHLVCLTKTVPSLVPAQYLEEKKTDWRFFSITDIERIAAELGRPGGKEVSCVGGYYNHHTSFHNLDSSHPGLEGF